MMGHQLGVFEVGQGHLGVMQRSKRGYLQKPLSARGYQQILSNVAGMFSGWWHVPVVLLKYVKGHLGS